MGRVLDGGGVMRGREGQGRKLSDWEAEEMASMRRGGATVRELAEQYGVCERTVSRYLRKVGGERRGQA